MIERQFNPEDYPNRLKAIKETKGSLSAEDVLFLIGIDRCPECNCAVGNGTDFKDFSNKAIVVCAQCDTEIYTEDENE
ncbi:MAG: hypothetical protein WC365_08865 [Candidatus Babeliales bacterium]|jgi:predicted Zn-dependent protease